MLAATELPETYFMVHPERLYGTLWFFSQSDFMAHFGFFHFYMREERNTIWIRAVTVWAVVGSQDG